MSEEMAVGDSSTSEEAKLNGSEVVASAGDAEVTRSEPPSDPPAPDTEVVNIKSEAPEISAEEEKDAPVEDSEKSETRGVKRSASAAFSDERGNVNVKIEPDEAVVTPGEEFKGFESVEDKDVLVDYSKIVERLESEVTAAAASFTPLKTVTATPPPLRPNKRLRTDTDGSRPSSALSSRSEGEGILLVESTSSPASRGRRATTIEMSSPLLRVPLERGWRRELVYRATQDQHSKRQADIYYYTPKGKKLRSTREVAEHLYGSGLTLENFSFFKEPLGVDDPEKEIIRDAKLMRRVDSPVAATAPPTEGKRTPKPKPPKGASPEPAKPETPTKIKVKSMGSRLSNSANSTPTAATAKAQKKPATPSAENNNTAAWKKPRQPSAPPPGPAPLPSQLAPLPPQLVPLLPQLAPLPSQLAPLPPQLAPLPPQPAPQLGEAARGAGPSEDPGASPVRLQRTPPPLQSRPQLQTPSPDTKSVVSSVQPCSLSCGLGVPSLCCTACLCLYHHKCAGIHNLQFNPEHFLCKNCRRSSSPPVEPPPLLHKSGVPSVAASLPAPPPALPIPVPAKIRPDKRVLLRMKVSSGGSAGERIWAVTTAGKVPPTGKLAAPAPRAPAPAPARPPPPRPAPPATALRALPQSLAYINGRKFIIVPRSMVQPSDQHDTKPRGRIANGAASPEVTSPRRRGRSKPDDTDYFTALCGKAKEQGYNVVVQMFQYLGMRDLAMSARVCRLWRQLAATPALWRHVRMKNSHVSDWGGLCAALKRHGTKRLDLRKMLLPQNDAAFWQQFAKHISTVDTLERIEMCRCPASAVEAVCRGVPGLRALSALAIKDSLLDPGPLGALPLLHELRLKSMAGLSLTRDLRPLAALTNLQHLSLTSIKELGWCLSDVVGQLDQLESLELGECTFRAEFAETLTKLKRLRRLRLERGTSHCAAPAILRALATLPLLTRLELVNIDVKVGFDDALAECKNIQRLLIIPTYVSQSATTNKQVLSGVLRLKDTLTHLMWGVTIELLRVTELFIDQCEQAGESPRRELGECIPVLKPVPGCAPPPPPRHVAGPPQVEILPLPTLQRLLSAQLPNTKLKLLRIPFHATWRQSLADFQ